MEIDESPLSSEPVQPRGATGTPNATTNPIRLLLVDDKLIMREGVRALLDREPGLHVVAQASSVAEAVALDVRPDVVITDAALPDARGNEVVVRLRRRYAQAGIFVLIDRDQQRLDEIVAAGATAGGGVDGYALKTATAEEFLSGVRTVAQGVQYVQPTLRSDMSSKGAPTRARAADRPDVPPEEAAFEALTTKEREVLELLVLGHTNSEIAALSKVSLRTVEARRARVLQKLGVRTRADLVRVARHLF
jgi:two-component system, NarL family, response regulator NreC